MSEPRPEYVTEIVCKNAMMFLALGSREEIIDKLNKAMTGALYVPFLDFPLLSIKTEKPTAYSIRPEEVFLVGNTRPYEDFEPVTTVKNKDGVEMPIWWNTDPTVKN